MSRRTVDLSGSTIVLTYPPDLPPGIPTPPAATNPHVDGRDGVHDTPDATGSACATHAPDRPQSGRPAPDERARLARNVGGLLRRERVGRGWNSTQLADAAGVALSTVWRLERGRCRPSEVMTRKLAVALRAESRRPVDAAVLDLELQEAAGDSLRRVQRRYPVRERRRRLYDEAAAMLAGRLPERGADVPMGMLMAVLDDAVERARGREEDRSMPAGTPPDGRPGRRPPGRRRG